MNETPWRGPSFDHILGVMRSRFFLRRLLSGAMLGAACVVVLRPAAAAAACPPEPRAACRSAGSTKLSFQNPTGEEQDRFDWTWSRGEATSPSEFGDPLAATTYSLCAWDASGIVLAIDVPPGGLCDGDACWSTQSSTGFRYRDSSLTNGAIRSIRLAGSSKARAKIAVSGRGQALPDPALPLAPPVTVQLLRDDSPICFESVFTTTSFSTNDTSASAAKIRFDPTAAIPALPSSGCGAPISSWPVGTSTPDSLVHDGLTRTFRVYVPPSYDPATPTPALVLLHGGFGSGAQVESSSRIIEVANEEGFLVVSPDGVLSPGGIRTWNAGTCCGYAVTSNTDDVGFVREVLDQLEANACVDRRRVYAAGMSNGAMLSHRLACDLADRVRAIAPVAGVDVTTVCAPARAVPMLEVHGTEDLNVPYDGGIGCGPSGVSTPSVDDSVARRAALNACSGRPFTSLVEGDGICTRQGKCPSGNDVDLCVIPNGGHHWPGGLPPAISGIGSCAFGYQSQTFSASRVLWSFFAEHPAR